MTDNVDVLVDLSAPNRLDELLSSHGFVREGACPLRHVATDVQVDLLIAGAPMPHPGAPLYPAPNSVEPSPHDPAFAALGAPLERKLYAHRHKDLADAVELLKLVDDAHYIEIEAAITPALRPELAMLRRGAVEELAFKSR